MLNFGSECKELPFQTSVSPLWPFGAMKKELYSEYLQRVPDLLGSFLVSLKDIISQSEISRLPVKHLCPTHVPYVIYESLFHGSEGQNRTRKMEN